MFNAAMHISDINQLVYVYKFIITPPAVGEAEF